ncbi:MAG: DUF1343 domain-containing protein [Balneolaceae bacterium]
MDVRRPANPAALWIVLLIMAGTLLSGCDREPGADLGPATSGMESQDGFSHPDRVQTGSERLLSDYLHELEGHRVGLVMNPTARVGEVHMLDTLLSLEVNVTALFAPEHGFRGEAGAGEQIEGGVDLTTGLPVFSLYGETRQPTPEMLGEVDLLLFDMQDVGARFYTWNSTLGLLLEAAADHGVPVWVLDRPNPAGGEYVSGWVMEDSLRSFVGRYPIPIAHGMTLGELARMMVGESWIETEGGRAPDLRVIEMRGWSREMLWHDTGLPWIAPSPNLPSFEHAYVYLGTCLVEGTTLSEGRGTDDPFLTIGSPTTRIGVEELAVLEAQIPGMELELADFTPISLPGKALYPKHEGVVNHGIRIMVTDFDRYRPVEAGLRLLTFLMERSEGAEVLPFFYRLSGSPDALRLVSGETSEPEFGLEGFMERRARYLLYGQEEDSRPLPE